MAWTEQKWRERTKQVFEAACRAGGVYEAWALRIGSSHAGGDVWVWDGLPMKAIRSIFRDCSRLLHSEEPFPIEGDAYEAIVPVQRHWRWMWDALTEREPAAA
jgi:hypothetical protein